MARIDRANGTHNTNRRTRSVNGRSAISEVQPDGEEHLVPSSRQAVQVEQKPCG
jgi:hypothetical protein